ncbi:MAG: AzlD domain-containing protein [Atopobiaceae bacterium]|nr:AzlD domain-containing protein [Atopobiaceae bacterium]
MSTHDFLFMYACLLGSMLACRCLPMFLLKGRDLPERVERILSLIPTAAFAALVANDLFTPGMFDAGIAGAMPLLAAAVVCFVAHCTGSLVTSAITGVVVYALLSLVL